MTKEVYGELNEELVKKYAKEKEINRILKIALKSILEEANAVPRVNRIPLVKTCENICGNVLDIAERWEDKK